MGNQEEYKNRFSGLPGAELVVNGIFDLQAEKISEEALLILLAAPRLRRLGIDIPNSSLPKPYEHQLYTLLETRFGDSAHSRYNSLLRRIASFSHALERER